MSKTEELNGAREALAGFGVELSYIFERHGDDPNVDFIRSGIDALCLTAIVSAAKLKSTKDNVGIWPIIPGQRTPHAWDDSRTFYPHMREFVDLSNVTPDSPVGLVAISATGLPVKADGVFSTEVDLIGVRLKPARYSVYGPGDDVTFTGMRLTASSQADGTLAGRIIGTQEHHFFTTKTTKEGTTTTAFGLEKNDPAEGVDGTFSSAAYLRRVLGRVTRNLYAGIDDNKG